MENKNMVSIPVEEYKALLEFKIRTDVSAEYEDKIKALKEEIESEKDSVRFWYSNCQNLEKQQADFKKKIADLENQISMEGGDA